METADWNVLKSSIERHIKFSVKLKPIVKLRDVRTKRK